MCTEDLHIQMTTISSTRLNQTLYCLLHRLALTSMLTAFFALPDHARAQNNDEAQAADHDTNSSASSFVFVPYPITEPAIGSGLLAGPVWMRSGPSVGTGPSKPQAYGFGALWTDGGSRGVVAFDHRAWDDGRWRTTALAGQADINFHYAGLSPEPDQDLGFTLSTTGFSLQAQRSLGSGPNSFAFRIFAARTKVDFDLGLPPELVSEKTDAKVAGVGLSWSRDTRDDIFTPSRGQSLSIGANFYPSFLGSSFDQQTLLLDWAGYRQALGKGVIGTRALFEASYGDPPFYLRPYVSLRGVSALRYAGETAGSVEVEYRQPLGKRWDVLMFAGEGAACSSRTSSDICKSVSTHGVGIRFKAKKLFGLTVGLDLAQGPDGSVRYIQIGNAWAR